MAKRGRWCLTLLSDHLPSGIVVLDASVLINLLGCGEPVAVLAGLGHKCLMEQRTLKEVRRHPIPGVELEPTVRRLLSDSTLEEVRMTDDEYEGYLSLVTGPLGTRLDDGESAALAIAARGASLILDERRARKRAVSLSNVPSIASTLRLMFTSGYRQGWDLTRVRDLVASARLHARMGVPREDSFLLEELFNGAAR